MDTAWVNLWLAYAHLKAEVCPAPGPINNKRLIEPNDELKIFSVKKNIALSVGNSAGDYRRVTEKTWNVFLKLYPNSGPAIKGTFKKVCILIVD